MSDDRQMIIETIQYFIDGFRAMDRDLVMRAFHPSASLSYVSPDGFREKAAVEWSKMFTVLKGKPDHPFHNIEFTTDIVYVDTAETAASARVDWVFDEFKWTDYYNFLKIDGRWYIMNKIWHETRIDK